MQEVSLRFMRYVAVWLLRVASQTDYTPDKTLQFVTILSSLSLIRITMPNVPWFFFRLLCSFGLKISSLPLPEKEPEAFASLPEYALQNVVENFKFAYRYVLKKEDGGNPMN